MQNLKNSDQQVIKDRLLNPSVDSLFSQKKDTKLQKNFASICDLFQSQAQKTPNSIAIIFGNQQLTYCELDEKSTQLAKFLRKQGIKQGVTVGLSLLKNEDLIISIIGILKAGGIYLPLDPSYPEERLKYMIDDANPFFILTQSGLACKLPERQACMSICLDKEWEKITSLDLGENPTELDIDPDSSAYVVYTSGSTGKPKGIVVAHKSLPNIVESRFDIYPKKPMALLVGSISFDPTLLTIFYTLISGGTLCIPMAESSSDLNKIVDLINKHSVNFLLCVTSFYSMLLETTPVLQTLEYVFVGGESLPAFLPSLHSRIVPKAYLFNEYGPAEHAIGGTIAKIYDPKERKIYPVTIGKALPNVQIYILDENLKPVFKGHKGEIFIGGIGLSKGYHNKEELTARKFIWANIHGQEPVRLYRTGDWGRLLTNEDIEFLGRIDHQVKIWGHRIELEEIESVIAQYNLVHEVIVVQGEKGKRLIAFYSTQANHDLEEELRTYSIRFLPNYMIPSMFVRINEWPKTPNGKLDREGLLSLLQDVHCLFSQSNFTLSQLKTEILRIWKKVLQSNTCGLNDNFFDLGGSSIQLLEVQTFINYKFKLNINIVDLFELPTVSKLADHLQMLLSGVLKDNLSTQSVGNG
jgi:amino acid adenylation domain-containing protein